MSPGSFWGKWGELQRAVTFPPGGLLVSRQVLGRDGYLLSGHLHVGGLLLPTRAASSILGVVRIRLAAPGWCYIWPW